MSLLSLLSFVLAKILIFLFPTLIIPKIKGKMHRLYTLLLLLFPLFLSSTPEQEFPVLFKGRFRPAEAYARLWLYEDYHAQSLKKKDLAQFNTNDPSALNLLFNLQLFGHTPWDAAPLFWIQSADTKKAANLNPFQDRFSYQELVGTTVMTEALQHFKAINSTETAYLERYQKLKEQQLPPKQIASTLEREFPLAKRLQSAGPLFRALPTRFQGEWVSLQALKTVIYSPKHNDIIPIGNFTLYSDDHFQAIRSAYLNWEKNQHPVLLSHLGQTLLTAYGEIAGQVHQEAAGKALLYPTLNQLKAETLYYQYPWIESLILLYAISTLLLIFAYNLKGPLLSKFSFGMLGIAFAFHTLLLLSRSYILNRPPVSNMFETVIYVPWFAVFGALVINFFKRHSFILIASAVTSIILLIILELADLNHSLDNVQAVLDSQFWLIIHVLMIVGSYGIFILGAVLGHIYLAQFLYHRTETPNMNYLAQCILQTLYLGTALLIPGTILGGVWAAESWGRFWDWDPKESWAFISSCLYLIWIHAYRYHKIASFGLAFGSVCGLLAISFTWYGVNYILGTGLHSYGFGSGGEIYYYAFLGVETAFLSYALWVKGTSERKNNSKEYLHF